MGQGSATNDAHCSVLSWPQAAAFTVQLESPEHEIAGGMAGEARFAKDPINLQQLRASAELGLLAGPVWLKSDVRARRNPTRMTMMALRAQKISELLPQL